MQIPRVDMEASGGVWFKPSTQPYPVSRLALDDDDWYTNPVFLDSSSVTFGTVAGCVGSGPIFGVKTVAQLTQQISECTLFVPMATTGPRDSSVTDVCCRLLQETNMIMIIAIFIFVCSAKIFRWPAPFRRSLFPSTAPSPKVEVLEPPMLSGDKLIKERQQRQPESPSSTHRSIVFTRWLPYSLPYSTWYVESTGVKMETEKVLRQCSEYGQLHNSTVSLSLSLSLAVLSQPASECCVTVGRSVKENHTIDPHAYIIGQYI